jgi:hypothetical protein
MSLYSLIGGRPGDFEAGLIGVMVGGLFGLFAMLPEISLRRRRVKNVSE